ncbi:MAG: site-specific DNA-methyltransferase [Saccharofermentanales bacterium]
MTNLNINEVYNGDCLELMNFIPDKSINMILADLPYGTTNCKWDSIIDLDELWIHYKRLIKDNGVIVLFAQTPFDKVLGCSNLEWLKYEWIWEKTQATGHLNAKKMPMRSHENILIFYKKQPTYNPIKTYGHKRKVSTAHHKRNTSTGEIYNKCDNFRDYDSTERYPRTIQVFASDKQKLNLHSTQKPLALCEYLIKTYTNEGDLILDNVAGSGTTLVAAKNLNRNFIGIEKEEKFYNIILERLKGNI